MLVIHRKAVLFVALLSFGLSSIGLAHGAASAKSKLARPRATVSSPAKKAASARVVRKKPSTVTAVSSRKPEIQDARQLAVKSSAALVVEQSGGDVLYQKNADTVAPIASITKLMTAMVVLDATPDLQATITITNDDVDLLRGSHSRLRVGSEMSRETALLLALMSSENRAAHALARHYKGGMPTFLSAMNLKARALGMRDTHFEDPTGLTSNNVSTASDLAKLVSAAYRYPIIRELTTTTEATVDVGRGRLTYRNTNPLVKNTGWEVGLSKTGYIQEAGKCLVMQARVADRPVVIVLLDSAGKLTRVGDANRIKRWIESSARDLHKDPVHASLDEKAISGPG